MRIAIIGTGKIGNTVGQLLAKTNHQITYGSRHPEKQQENLGENARVATVIEAIDFGEVVLLALPWEVAEDLLQDSAKFAGKIIIDATNQYIKKDRSGPQSPDNLEVKDFPDHSGATQYRTELVNGVPLIKSYNTLTAEFQQKMAGRTGADRVVMPYAGDDKVAKKIVAQLIEDSGFAPFDVGNADRSKFIEPPRGEYSLYGEKWNEDNVQKQLDQLIKKDENHTA